MDQQVAGILEDAVPGRDIASVTDAGPSWNENNRTVEIGFADGETIYLKYATDGDGSRIQRERAVIDYVDANCPVGVPTVLAADTEREQPYLATAPLAGRSCFELWADWSVPERATMARRIGQALATIHATRFDDHGLICGGDATDLEIQSDSWANVLAAKVEYLRSIAVSDQFDHYFEDALAAIEASRDLLNDAPAALLHGDPTRGNSFRGADGAGVGFIDWEDAYVGDPARERRRAQQQLIEPIHHSGAKRTIDALYDGYREQEGGLPEGFDERRPIYEVTAFLDTSGFFDTWAPDAEDPTDDLAAWVDEEMQRRLAEAE